MQNCLPLVLEDVLSIILDVHVLCREGSGGVMSLAACCISLFKEKRSCNILHFVHSYVHVYYVCLKIILGSIGGCSTEGSGRFAWFFLGDFLFGGGSSSLSSEDSRYLLFGLQSKIKSILFTLKWKLE